MANDWLTRRRKSEAARAARMVPMPMVRPKHCRWCRGALTGRRTSWHPECKRQYDLHTALWAMRPYLERRDGNRCHDCAAVPIRTIHDVYMTSQMVTGPDGSVSWIQYQAVQFVTGLQVDHDTPIWATRVLPRADRIPFFGPSNARLRCDPCHKAKTKREAATRAQHRKRNR
jgi:hypothetical protein